MDLRTFCNQLGSALRLPVFHFDDENVWEWGLTRIEQDEVEVNVSRKHAHGEPLWNEPIHILFLVENTAPLRYDREWVIGNLVTRYGQAIADLTGQPAYYGKVEYLGEEDFSYQPSRKFEPQK